MGRYIDWTEVVDRYPDARKVGDANFNFDRAYVKPAESQVDGALAPRYTVPFVVNSGDIAPPQIADLVIDMAYYRAVGVRSKFFKNISADISSRMGALQAGTIRLVDAMGNLLPTNVTGILNTALAQGYQPSFGMDDPTDWAVNSDWQQTYKDIHDPNGTF